jgi:hypothetical protein
MRTGQIFHYIACTVALSLFATIGSGPLIAKEAYRTPGVSEFLANPGALLKQYPDGGARLADLVQQLALTDSSTFKIFIDLVAIANPSQRASIGEGLAQAAKIKVLTNRVLAEDWEDQIAAIDDPNFKAAATAALGDVRLGAVGGGPLGGSGGARGGMGGGPSVLGGLATGVPVDIRARPVATPHATITGSTVAGPSFTLTIVKTNASYSVSP